MSDIIEGMFKNTIYVSILNSLKIALNLEYCSRTKVKLFIISKLIQIRTFIPRVI